MRKKGTYLVTYKVHYNSIKNFPGWLAKIAAFLPLYKTLKSEFAGKDVASNIVASLVSQGYKVTFQKL